MDFSSKVKLDAQSKYCADIHERKQVGQVIESCFVLAVSEQPKTYFHFIYLKDCESPHVRSRVIMNLSIARGHE